MRVKWVAVVFVSSGLSCEILDQVPLSIIGVISSCGRADEDRQKPIIAVCTIQCLYPRLNCCKTCNIPPRYAIHIQEPQLSESSFHLPALLPHLHHTLDRRLEALLEPSPPPLTVQTLPFRAASLVEPLPAKVPAHAVPANLRLHELERSRNVEASRVVHVNCSSQCRAEFHRRWLGHWRRTAAVASGVE